MGSKKREIKLSEKVRTILESNTKKRNINFSLKQRSQIILMSANGKRNQEIATLLGIHYNIVWKWRSRFLNCLPVLDMIEETLPEELEKSLMTLFSDLPRSGAPCKYTQEQRMKIIDLACKNPMDYQHEVSQWSTTLLAQEAEKQGIVEHISASSVNRFLKSGGFKAAQDQILAKLTGKAGRSGIILDKSQ